VTETTRRLHLPNPKRVSKPAGRAFTACGIRSANRARPYHARAFRAAVPEQLNTPRFEPVNVVRHQIVEKSKKELAIVGRNWQNEAETRRLATRFGGSGN